MGWPIFREGVMKRFLIAMMLTILVVSCAKSTPRVLLFIRNGSPDLEFMLRREVGVMKEVLERSGFKVTVATLDGAPLSAGAIRMQPDIRLSDVNVADYEGFIMPCMAAGTVGTENIHPESVALVKKAISAGKPVAAQLGAVNALAQSGLLKGKRYAYAQESQDPCFKGAIYGGPGVVRDGLFLTSGLCPYMARTRNMNDGTEQLAIALVEAIKGSK
jgi:putative intracellular protease/amidase